MLGDHRYIVPLSVAFSLVAPDLAGFIDVVPLVSGRRLCPPFTAY